MDVRLVSLIVGVGSKVTWSFETDFVNVTDAVTLARPVTVSETVCVNEGGLVSDCVKGVLVRSLLSVALLL